MKSRITALLALSLLALTSSTSSAALTIGDFETAAELSAWTPTGGGITLSGPVVGVTPTLNLSMARLTTTASGGLSASQIESLLGLTPNSFSNVIMVDPQTSGQAMYFDVGITPVAGADLTFDWSFITQENLAAVPLPDAAIFSVFNLDTLAPVNPTVLATADNSASPVGTVVSNPNSAGGYNFWTGGLQSVSVNISVAGNYRIGFAIADGFIAGAPGASALLVDNVVAAPEPTSLALCVLGFAAVGFRRKRS